MKKEIALRSKLGVSSGESILISNLSLSPALEFERYDATRRLRLVLSELLAIIGHLQKGKICDMYIVLIQNKSDSYMF